MTEYIKWIREKIGHQKIFLNFTAACIVNENGEILLQKRGDFKGWGFPGGALELGESAEEALIREVKEETGIDIKIEKLLGIYTKYFCRYPNGDEAQTILFVFVCRPTTNKLYIDHKETLDLQYVKQNELPTLFNKQHQDALQDYLNGRLGVFR